MLDTQDLVQRLAKSGRREQYANQAVSDFVGNESHNPALRTSNQYGSTGVSSDLRVHVNAYVVNSNKVHRVGKVS